MFRLRRTRLSFLALSTSCHRPTPHEHDPTMTDSNFSLAPLPTSTPQTSVYPCESGTQHARNNFVPRTFTRVPSGAERGESLLHILKKYWGYSKFRPPQQEVCELSLKGCDVLVVAPTGIGKSICFQLPALTIEYGITIVVSPLKALMAEQVMSLREKGIPVAALNENTSRAEHVFVSIADTLFETPLAAHQIAFS